MTNTKFRKRALLSSVAMLLVALVALGSATFAWFVDDPKADATGITATAQTSTGLLINSDTFDKWDHHATLATNNTGIVLAPATTNNGSTYFQATAKGSNALGYEAAETIEGSAQKWRSVTVNNGTKSDSARTVGTGVYHEQMQLKRTVNLTGAQTQPVKLTGLDLNLNTANTMYTAVTVVLMVDGSIVKTYNSTGTDLNTWKTLSTTTDVDSTTDATLAADAAAASGLDVTMGTFSASKTQINVDMYVFLDGQNSNVYTDNSDASDLITSIKAYFELGTLA